MEIVELRGGLLVREDALALAIDLEFRGFAFAVKDGKLHVSGGKLTEADTTAIKALRRHLMAVVTYESSRPV